MFRLRNYKLSQVRSAAAPEAKLGCKEHGLETDYWFGRFECCIHHHVTSIIWKGFAFYIEFPTGALTIQLWSASIVSSLELTGATMLRLLSTGLLCHTCLMSTQG